MNNSQALKLSECLLYIDQKILFEAYEIDNSNKLKEYFKSNKAKAKNSFYITPTFRRVALAVCLTIVTVTSSFLIKKPYNNLTSNNSSTISNPNNTTSNNSSITSQTPSNNVIYGDPSNSNNDHPAFTTDIKSIEEKYLSSELQEKMELYKDSDVVYRLIVCIFITEEDYAEADKLINTNEEVQLLFEQKEAAYEDYCKVMDEYVKLFNSMNGVNDPEKIKKIKRLVAAATGKEKTYDELNRKWTELCEELREDFLDNIIDERVEYAFQFGENISGSTFNTFSCTYFMDLTAEEINILAEKGGYALELVPAPDEDATKEQNGASKHPPAINN